MDAKIVEKAIEDYGFRDKEELLECWCEAARYCKRRGKGCMVTTPNGRHFCAFVQDGIFKWLPALQLPPREPEEEKRHGR